METSFDLPAIPPLAEETRQAWVYRLLREAILGGSLKAGMRLPSTRSLSRQLAVSRSTIEVAFDQLRAEGYASGVVGSGTYVNATLPDGFIHPRRRTSQQRRNDPAPISQDPGVSATAVPTRRDVAFVARVADPRLFPLSAWRRHLQTAARSLMTDESSGDDPFGVISLRTQVARYLGAARGIACDPSQVIIVTGIRQALNLSARTILKATDKVLIEDPGYALVAEIFAPHAQSLVPVAVDAAGFSVANARRHRGARVVHVTPAHQSPTGVTMPVSRRIELLTWAEENDAWILEDDYDSEFNYRSAPLPALKSLDHGDRVIHCGSFNKTMFADLRIGYAVVPRKLVLQYAATCRAMGPSVGVIEQRALASFISDGSLARHVRRSRNVYAGRRDRVLQELREAVAPEPLRTSGEHGGFHFVWWLPKDLAAQELVAQASMLGLRLDLVAGHCRRVEVPPSVLIGDSAVADELLEHALARLRKAIVAARAK